MSDTLIEAVARAITYVEGCGPLAGCKICADPQREDSCLHAARAAIAAIEASGTHRVVPVVSNDLMELQGKHELVTRDMKKWGAKYICALIYADMVAAAPKVTE